jgi:hypothetical protein
MNDYDLIFWAALERLDVSLICDLRVEDYELQARIEYWEPAEFWFKRVPTPLSLPLPHHGRFQPGRARKIQKMGAHADQMFTAEFARARAAIGP